MPKLLATPCSYPNCPEVTRDQYCSTHKKHVAKQYDRIRGSSTKRGYDYRWRKVRKWFLRENPLCVECLKEKRAISATVVDHISPHKGDLSLFWDQSNWQALCKRCHDIKTVKEDGGWGR
jgi:5-methylcytosine-specific restriction protein A